MTEERSCFNADYYQDLHDNNKAFIDNNWLLSEFDLIRASAGDAESVLELGCGNGRFLELAATVWRDVTGVDWARSPRIDVLLGAQPRIGFLQTDVATLNFSRSYDLIVSADFFEHLPGSLLPRVISESLRAGRINFHKIACYDDGHSHLSILSPDEWLDLFSSQPGGHSMRIVTRELRKGNPENIVITLSNVPGGGDSLAQL